jgi:hypothetical protein
MTAEERLAADRAHAQKLLSGTALVPTKTCRKCGKYALVKDGQLEMNEGCGFSGTSVVPEIAICLNAGCGHIAARSVSGLKGYRWRYGRADVGIVDGSSSVERNLPQPITAKQRGRIEEFLAETA